jgi:broad specificity phosphatase PhoE
MSKLLHLIRHGYALHNELFIKMNLDVNAFRIPEAFDAPLTLLGHEQSRSLGKEWSDKNKVDLVIVSPLTRTLETAINIFGDTNIPIVSHEFLREYPVGRDTCNQRKTKDVLIKYFPRIDFSGLDHNDDIFWKKDERDMETVEELDIRIHCMKEYLLNRPETNIAIVGHSSFIGHFKDNYIPLMENGDEELKHCYPYPYILKRD